jgi:hypothetical protein
MYVCYYYYYLILFFCFVYISLLYVFSPVLTYLLTELSPS